MDSEVMLWDQLGKPVLILANDWLLDLDGTAVGFVERDGAVYDLKGRHVAWLSGGIVRDLSGCCVAYSEVVNDHYHPPLPTRERPLQSVALPQAMVHPLASVPTLPPLPRSAWSSLRPQDIFDN